MSQTYQPLSKALACASGLLHDEACPSTFSPDDLIDTLINWCEMHSQNVCMDSYDELINDCKNFYRTLSADIFIARCVTVNVLTFMQPKQRWLIRELVAYYKEIGIYPVETAEKFIDLGLHDNDS